MNTKPIKYCITILFLFFWWQQSIFAQIENSESESELGIIDSSEALVERGKIDPRNEDRSPIENSGGIVEQIIRISPYGKILVITNSDNHFGEGDYISFYEDSGLIARLLVAKADDKKVGIKLVKVYSPEKWKNLGSGQKVKIIKGDDSFFKATTAKTGEDQLAQAQNEKDLESMSEEELLKDLDGITLEENRKRIIRTDNIVSVNYGQTSSNDNKNNSKKYAHLSGQWAYQFRDNLWGEFIYGQSKMRDFPSEGADSTLNLYALRIKYTFEGPSAVYLQPYAGARLVKISSPPPSPKQSDEQKKQEGESIKNAEKISFILGISILKRLVPGWFVRSDIGLDLINLGFGLEF